MATETKQELNPQILKIKVGSRNLREVNLYPFSYADQMKFTDIIFDAIKEFAGSDLMQEMQTGERTEEESIDFGVRLSHFALDTIQKNLPKLIGIVTDNELTEIDDLTNAQFVQIAEYVFDVNYGDSLKNVMSLLTKAKSIFQLKKSSPESASPTAATGLKTSIESPFVKEA